MSHALRVYMEISDNSTERLWEIFSNFTPNKSLPQAKMLAYLSQTQCNRSYLENNLIPKLELDYSIWLDNNFRPHRANSEEEAWGFKHFASVKFRNSMIYTTMEGYPPGGPMATELSLRLPSAFIYHDLEYRKICRDVVAEFADSTRATTAIFFEDYGDIEDIYINNYCPFIDIYDYGKDFSRPISEFYDEIHRIASPLDWDKDYSDEEQEFAQTAFFIDKYR